MQHPEARAGYQADHTAGASGLTETEVLFFYQGNNQSGHCPDTPGDQYVLLDLFQPGDAPSNGFKNIFRACKYRPDFDVFTGNTAKNKISQYEPDHRKNEYVNDYSFHI